MAISDHPWLLSNTVIWSLSGMTVCDIFSRTQTPLFLKFFFFFFGWVTSVRSTSDQQIPTFSENGTFPEADTTSCTLFSHSFKLKILFTATWRHVVLLKFTMLPTVATWKWRCSLTLGKVVLVQMFLLSRYVTRTVVLSVSLCFKLLTDLYVQ